jgi:hypothetical protein
MRNFVGQFRHQLGDFTKANCRVHSFGFTCVVTFFLSIFNYNQTERTKSRIQIHISKMLYFAQRGENNFILFLSRMDLQTQNFFPIIFSTATQSKCRSGHFKYLEPRSRNLNRYHNQIGASWPWPPHCSNINTSDYFCGNFVWIISTETYLILLWSAKWHMQLPEAAVQMLFRQMLQNILTRIRSVSEVSVNILIMLRGNIRISCG